MFSSWPTPNAGPQNDSDQNWQKRREICKAKHGNNGFGLTLGMAATAWQTPVADDAPDRTKGKINSRGEPKLSAQAAQWPTPAAQNVKGSSPDSVTRADGKSRMDILHYLAEQGFSRPAPETPQHGPKLSQLRPIWRPLRASVIASHGRATWRRLWKGRTKRRLNPGFVEWLMGWPPGHALCACSATEFTLWQQLLRGALSLQPTASGPWIWEPPAETPQPQQMTLL